VSARLGPRLGADSVGQRVVLRRRLPGGRFADVLGDLVAWDRDGDGLARVVTRHHPLSHAVGAEARAESCRHELPSQCT